jgi:hypothetical protein
MYVVVYNKEKLYRIYIQDKTWVDRHASILYTMHKEYVKPKLKTTMMMTTTATTTDMWYCSIIYVHCTSPG